MKSTIEGDPQKWQARRAVARARRADAWKRLQEVGEKFSAAMADTDALDEVLSAGEVTTPSVLKSIRLARANAERHARAVIPELRAVLREFYAAEADAICLGVQKLDESEDGGVAAGKLFDSLLDGCNAHLADLVKVDTCEAQ